MDINPLNRLKNLFPILRKEKIDKNSEANKDRDAHGGSDYQKNNSQKKPWLTKEQQEMALKNLNEHASFQKAGLKAEISQDSDRAPHVIVKDRDGHVVRHIPYTEFAQLYWDRFMTQKDSGRLLNKAA